MKFTYRKKDIENYNQKINYIRNEMADDRDFWASLFSSGLTFNDDIEKFCRYASAIEAFDISNEIIKEHPEYA